MPKSTNIVSNEHIINGARIILTANLLSTVTRHSQLLFVDGPNACNIMSEFATWSIIYGYRFRIWDHNRGQYNIRVDGGNDIPVYNIDGLLWHLAKSAITMGADEDSVYVIV